MVIILLTKLHLCLYSRQGEPYTVRGPDDDRGAGDGQPRGLHHRRQQRTLRTQCIQDHDRRQRAALYQASWYVLIIKS